MTERKKRYWGFRVDNKNLGYFKKELAEGRLRQGWGYEESHNLRNDIIEGSAKKNLPIFRKVKKGDVLIVPHITFWNDVTIIEATEDFDKGYSFSIDPKVKDYGHIFPVKILKEFTRKNENVDSEIRKTLKCRSRFWNIDKCAEEIEAICSLPANEVLSKSSLEQHFSNAVIKSFDEDLFATKLYENLCKNSQAYEWEYVLANGFKQIFPDNVDVRTTANSKEKEHGADILITLPGVLGMNYVIAIQVKDYEHAVSSDVINQICKAEKYYNDVNAESYDENVKLIDKYLIITEAKRDENNVLEAAAKKENVKIVFADELKDLLLQMGRGFLGKI